MQKINIAVLASQLIFLSINTCIASDSEKGLYEVCFESYETYDHARWYVRGTDTISRPLLIHFWYPSLDDTHSRHLDFKHYIDLIARRENFGMEATEVDQSSYNFIHAYSEFAKRSYGLDSGLTTQHLLDSPVSAKSGAAINQTLSGFPLIIYAPSNSKSSVQNHMICEFLASHGFMILSVGSAGANSMQRNDAQESTLAQVTDMEFILEYLGDSLHIEYSNLGLLGFSSGGLATSVFQMRHKEVKAVFSMDGGHEYGSYVSLFNMEDFNLEKTNVPYGLVVNNYENFSIYPYYHSVRTTDKQMFRMPFLDHNGFVSFWRFFDSCSTDTVSNKVSISYDYLSNCALAFFSNYLKPASSKNDGWDFRFSANEYIQPVHQDHSSIAGLCNLMLGHNMDAVRKQLQENQVYFYSKENEINILARMFIDHHIDQSIFLYLYNVANHPDSWQAHYNLGYAYKQKGQPVLSKDELLKALELNPGNTDITNLLEEAKE